MAPDSRRWFRKPRRHGRLRFSSHRYISEVFGRSMDAAQEEGIDSLASLEERITRAVQTISALRNENIQLQQRVKAAEEQSISAKSELDEAQALSAEFQKENAALEAKVNQLSHQVDEMRGERKQVKTRIEKLLNQLDLLS